MGIHLCPIPEWGNADVILAGTAGSLGFDTFHLNNPHGVFMDGYDNLYVADTNNHRIMRFSPGESLPFFMQHIDYTFYSRIKQWNKYCGS